MEKITVVVFLANGTQLSGHFTSNHKVQDLRSFVDVASGFHSSDSTSSNSNSGGGESSNARGAHNRSYQLMMVSPDHRKLDNSNEILCSSTVVQLPSSNASEDIDPETESGSSFYRRRVSTPAGTSGSSSYYDQIMQAFMFTATNLVGVALLALIYYNIVMFWPYITPFFFALVVGLALRPPRDKIVAYLAPLTKIESNKYKFGMIMYFKKIQYIAVEMLNYRSVPYVLLGGLAFLTLSILNTTMLGSWEPVVGVVCFFLVVLIITLVFGSPPTFAATLLLGSILLLACTLGLFAVTSLFREVSALRQALEPHIKYLADRNFAADALLEMMGVSGEDHQGVLESLSVVLTKLNSTAGLWGFNISAITTLSDLSAPAQLTNTIPGVQDFMNYDFTNFSAIFELFTSNWAVTIWKSFMWAFGTGVSVLKIIASFSSSLYNLVISLIVFTTSLYLMLVSNTNWVADAVRMIPVANNKIYDQIQQVFSGIVLTTFVACAANAVCTYLVVAWGANFILPFMYTFVNALVTLFPVLIYPWVLQIILVGHLILRGQYVRGVVVGVLFLLLMAVDEQLYSVLAPAPHSHHDGKGGGGGGGGGGVGSQPLMPHKWVVGLSVVLGLYSFGPQGILVGPILVYITVILYKGMLSTIHGMPCHAIPCTYMHETIYRRREFESCPRN